MHDKKALHQLHAHACSLQLDAMQPAAASCSRVPLLMVRRFDGEVSSIRHPDDLIGALRV